MIILRRAVCVRDIGWGARVVAGPLAFAIPDAHPVSPGHTLVIPRREQLRYGKLTEDEIEMLVVDDKRFAR